MSDHLHIFANNSFNKLSQKTPSDLPQPPTPLGTIRQVLIVKNPEMSSNNCRDLLVGLGLSVFEVFSVDTGIIATQAKLFDLIIISLFLKGKCGFSMARVLRKTEAYKNTPLIATAPIDITEEKTSLLQNFNEFLSEPIKINQMIPILEKYKAKIFYF